MSRSYSSYDEDWQRRKSVLIRSLFHDIPILSPVEEESNDSSQDYYVPTQEPFPSPPRPYSPLPPLIIEKVPITNKHDEPEDYYNKLYNKIKRIYKDLFIEKRNFSSIDYDSNCSESSVNNDSVSSVENVDYHYLDNNDKSPDNENNDSIIEDRDTRRTSATTKSDGYGADFESMETGIIDVVNYTTSNEDGVMISEVEESDSESTDENGINNKDSESTRSSEESGSSRSTDNKESRRETIDYPEFRREEMPHHTIIDDREMTEGEESIEPEDEQSYEKEGSDNENIDEHDVIEPTSKAGDSDTERIDDPMFSGGEVSHNSSTDDHEKSESEKCNDIEKEPQPNNITQRKLHSFEKELKSKGFEKSAIEDGNDLMESSVEPMEADVETSDSSEGPSYMQITTAAMVHYDGSQDAEERESQIYEDSAKSIILPTRFRRAAFRGNVDADDRIEVLQILEENADSTTTPSSYTDETTKAEFEATPQLEAKEEGIIKMKAPQANAHNEYDEEISTSEEDDEEISTPQPDSAKQDVEGMGSSQPAARNEKTEKMRTPQPDCAEEDVEGMSSSQPAARDKETKITEAFMEEMSPPRFDTPEGDDEEITSPQPESAEEDIEGVGSPQRAARDEETKATEEDVEEMGSPHPIEQMRTPRPDLSHGTIPITRQSNSESASEHTAAPQEHSALTSSTQDGADHNMSEIHHSNDINEILTSIFNESRDKDRTISGRKRKLVDKSVQAVQTSRVTWEEMRANFFIGTPKIFRLCACTDHICY